MSTGAIGKKSRVGRMINHVAHPVVWITLIMVAGCSNREQDVSITSEDSGNRGIIFSAAHIDDIFSLEREVVLTDSIFIGNYTYLDVDANGNFLISDMVGKQVLLFDKNGHYKKTLSTEPCDPGFPWSPLHARFKPEGNIIVSSGIWGYEFSNEGNCIGPMDDEFGSPHTMGFNKQGHIYGFYVHGQQDTGYHIKEMDKRGRTIRKFGFGKEYFWYTMRNLSIPDIVIDKDGHVYHAKIFSPHIDKYDESGEFMIRLGKKPNYYRKLELNDSAFDFSNDAGTIRSESVKANGKFTITRKLFLLNDETIIVRYHNEYKKDPDEKFGLTFMDLEGNDLIDGDILTHISFITAKDGLAYSFFDSTNTGKGFAAGSPSLKIYRYLPPAQ